MCIAAGGGAVLVCRAGVCMALAVAVTVQCFAACTVIC